MRGSTESQRDRRLGGARVEPVSTFCAPCKAPKLIAAIFGTRFAPASVWAESNSNRGIALVIGGQVLEEPKNLPRVGQCCRFGMLRICVGAKRSDGVILDQQSTHAARISARISARTSAGLGFPVCSSAPTHYSARNSDTLLGAQFPKTSAAAPTISISNHQPPPLPFFSFFVLRKNGHLHRTLHQGCLPRPLGRRGRQARPAGCGSLLAILPRRCALLVSRNHHASTDTRRVAILIFSSL